MPLLELSLVTEAIMFVLQTRVPEILGILEANPTSAPPDDVSEETTDNVLSLFLYHVKEDPHFRNAPPMSGGIGVPEVAQAPMGLNLYFVLTAHHKGGTSPNENTLREQLLFGGALKALHDVPVINEHTVVGGTNVFEHVNIDPGNVIEIIYRPLPPEDSISFWSSEQNSVTRLSAYYEVRTIFLRPEPPALAAAGLVLSLGTYVFTDGSPQLTRGVSRIGFALPANVGSLDRAIELSPARVALLTQDDSALIPALPSIADGNNRLDLEGTGLARDGTTLHLSSARWVEPGNPTGTIVVSRDDNPYWYAGGITAQHLVRVRVRPQVDVDAVTLDVLPGSYTARVTVSRTVTLSDPGSTRTLEMLSNAVGLTVTPQIHEVPSISDMDQSGSLTIVGDYLLHADVEVLLFIGGVAFVESSGAPAAGEFQIDAGGSLVQFELTPELDAALTPNSPLPLRLLVNGADAPPAWIERP
ncbi:DUF4255 domain-containing protein [Paraliomyxa miuraensis]|uniref:DUF4255 domain-containing protein n=1 Tax=Paraliomyxa miuraensis TaxID=376150 RepID=UPI002250BF4A|nr:DUF4255 domain-containing protein [Paraliomyxa miuraensis]MCX4247470.1 DUF4255 domain-containing protein [Paraliomyxa miuraensis]